MDQGSQDQSVTRAMSSEDNICTAFDNTSDAVNSLSKHSRGSEVNTDLINAIKSNNITNVCKLNKRGVNVNEWDDGHKTPLFYAVENNNKTAVDVLVKSGADVNVTDSDDKTVLFHAVDKNHQGMVVALIEAGIEVNKTDFEGKTSLFYAVKNKNAAMVKLLIDNGSQVDMADYNGKTNLMYAVKNKSETLVHVLIDYEADVNRCEDNTYKTALFYAVENDDQSMVSVLIDAGADVNMTDYEGKSPLFYAVQNSNQNVVKTLINKGADVSLKDSIGETALHYAARNIEEIAVQSFPEFEHEDAAFHVSDKSNIVIARTLIDDGDAFINARDLYGRTPLFYALPRSTYLADYLLQRGANFNLKDSFNVSILSFYIEHCIKNKQCSQLFSPSIFRKSYTFRLLKGQGILAEGLVKAILNVVFCKIPLISCPVFDSRSCPNAIRIIQLCNAVRVARQYLEKEEGKKDKIFSHILSLMEGDEPNKRVPEILDCLTRLGANPTSADKAGNTALHYVARLPALGVSQDIVMNICRHLRKFGALFDAKNHKHETPLQVCLSESNVKLVANGYTEVCAWSRKFKIIVEVCKLLMANESNWEFPQYREAVLRSTIKLSQQVIRIEYQSVRENVMEEALAILKLVSNFQKKYSVNREEFHIGSILHLWASLEVPSALMQRTTEYQYYETFLEESLKEILECGALLNARNKKEETPLHLCKTWSAVNLLLKAGARANDLDSSGCSPLAAAVKMKSFLPNGVNLFPDVKDSPETFWRSAIERGFNPWIIDKEGESILSTIVRCKAFPLAKGLIDVACEDNHIQTKDIAVSLLTSICKDKDSRSTWKHLLVKQILKSIRKNETNLEEPLLCCCRNIIEAEISKNGANWVKRNAASDDEPPPKKKRRNSEELEQELEKQSSVHYHIVKLFLSLPENQKIPKNCLELAKTSPALEKFLMICKDMKEAPILIPWTSISSRYEQKLEGISRGQDCLEINSFLYKDHIGSGSFGHIFLGINKNDGREVAIKRIEKLRIHRPEEKREITSLTAVADCEQVVRYLSYIENDDFSFIVLELMEGNLNEYLDKSYDADKNISLCKDVLRGLKYLHDKKIIHRDLKPTNILYKNHPRLCLKIADFGLSLRLDHESTSTVYGTHAGTKCWMAPEILKSAKCHSYSSDIFSCGLILHYILSGKRHPFSPTGILKGQLQIAHITEENIMNDNLQGWDGSLSPEADRLIKRMLDNTENQRLSAAHALIQPFFWSKKQKIEFLHAVGCQKEFECPRSKRNSPLSCVESSLENRSATIIPFGTWKSLQYRHMPAICSEMGKRKYDSSSVVELVRFIRNTYSHASEDGCCKRVQKLLLEDYVFLDYFPHLILEVLDAVRNGGWSVREGIDKAIPKI